MLIARYLSATLAASICFVCLLTAPAVWTIGPNVPTEIILSDLVMVPILVVLTALIAGSLALPWASLAILFANRFRVDRLAYWVIAGAISGGAAASFGIWAFDDYPSFADDGSMVTYATEWWRLVPMSLIAGAVGGFAFRWVERRRSSSARQ